MTDFRWLRAEVKKQLALREWKHKDLAKATGYSPKSIDSFMCGSRASKKLTEAVVKALDISENRTA